MRVVHCVGWYLPQSVGGSELYVHGLARALRAHGVETIVMAPASDGLPDRYVYDGVEVVRYPVVDERSLDQHEGRDPHGGFEVFQRELETLRPDVFHLHSFTYGSGLHHLRHARSLGLATLVTFHVPGMVCARGTMMRFGREACDGLIDARQCVPCWLMSRGLPEVIAIPAGRLLRSMPEFGQGIARTPLRTVLRAPTRIEASGRVLHELVDLADRAVVVCVWLRDALLLNGVAEHKLAFYRQAVTSILPVDEWGPLPSDRPHSPLRIGYFGRGTRVKGVDVLVRAVCSLPRACRVELSVHAPTNSEEDRDYMAKVRAITGTDSRVRFVDPVAAADIQASMRRHDVVAVPSVVLETGPLVAMEALAAGVPVLGSDLGGLRELIEPGINGWLVRANDVTHWAKQIETLSAPGAAVLHWHRDDTSVLTTQVLAERMFRLYEEILS